MTAEIAVVVPYFAQQSSLDLVLAALELQTVDHARLEVVVADDGSPTPPDLGERPYAVRAVRQEDLGFRASAARRLGAAATTAPVLCFLDADTVPEPDYLARLTAVVTEGPCGTVAVGRRRHADLGGWTRERLRAWLGGTGEPPAELAEPRWLREAYAASRDLRDADDRSYRFVISAVLALTRETYDAAGGFDPSFVGYGGEDWDLAHRCWLAGADLRHVPEAVAWHDGPDFAGRADDDARRTKDRETLQLARVLTDPCARGAGLLWPCPQVAVTLAGAPDAGTLAATASAVLRDADAALWLPDLDALPDGLPPDPRLHAGPPPTEVLRRARHQVHLTGPVLLDRPLRELVEDGPARYAADGRPLLVLHRTRDLARGEQDPAHREAGPAGIRPLGGDATLEARWGGWA
ncbi:glycosyltransferase family 2 protein [Arsenicicoccus dermatophilus]|uniref:glycosyltransferase family 2 protein n=1 Tax=Arsenicicoccus dermatophilus TaxID=1076331 RepID=UPI001F4C9ACD|nr:glycosyltransferase [Arsenicicoccus dermatophilus]MCH8611942.1 glycosyltransferase [Arsenicicoccus dermatophilus]